VTFLAVLLSLPPQAPAIPKPPQAPAIPASWTNAPAPPSAPVAAAPRYEYRWVQTCGRRGCTWQQQIVRVE